MLLVSIAHATGTTPEVIIQSMDDRMDELEVLLTEQHEKNTRLHAQTHAKLDYLVENQSRVSEPEAGIVSNANLWPQSRYLQGREADLARLHKAFNGNQTQAVALVQTIHGIGGIGKTQTAISYANTYRREYGGGIWFFQAEREEQLATEYADLAERLRLPEAAQNDPITKIYAVCQHLRNTDRRWLLVFDNAQRTHDFTNYLPGSDNCDVLLTSRSNNWHDIANVQPLDVLNPEPAASLLMERSGDRDKTAANALAKDLGYLPLALEQAGAYIRKNAASGETLAKYLSALRENPAGQLGRGATLAGRYDQIVANTWARTFEAIYLENPAASQALIICAFLDPERIPLKLLLSPSACLPEILNSTLQCKNGYSEIVSILTEYSMLTGSRPNSDQSFNIHRLVQAVIRGTLEREEISFWSNIVIGIMTTQYPVEITTSETIIKADALYAHVITSATHAIHLGLESVRCANLLSTTALTMASQHRYALALPPLKRSLAAFEKIFANTPNHPVVAMCNSNLGYVLQAQGSPGNALTYYKRALAMQKEIHGDNSNHPMLAMSLTDLGFVLEDLSEFNMARWYFKQALAMQKKIHAGNPMHPDIASSLNNLGHVFREQGNLRKACRYWKRALTMLKAIHADTPNNSEIAKSLKNLGDLHRALGRQTKARSYYEQALSMQKALHADNPNHPDINTSLEHLGYLLRTHGDLEAARTYYEQVLKMQEAIYAHTPNHLDVAISLSNIGQLYLADGDDTMARKYFKKAISLRERSGM